MNEIEMKISDLSDYRAALYASFDYCADAQMDLIDALLSNTTAQSVVALSLSPFFRRHYSSITTLLMHFPFHIWWTSPRLDESAS